MDFLGLMDHVAGGCCLCRNAPFEAHSGSPYFASLPLFAPCPQRSAMLPHR